jgi:hypothetical protein
VSDNQTPSARQKIREIKQAGYFRGRFAGNQCDACGKNCGRGWWRKVSYRYWWCKVSYGHSAWACFCRDCAHKHIHPYDKLIHSREEGSA